MGEAILVVEDMVDSLKVTASALRSAGYRVTIASTAEQAWSTLRTLQPDLVLVDFMLPGMSGLELATQIRQEKRLRKTRVVAFTACNNPDDESRAREAGCQGYIKKPIDLRSLVAQVRGYLDNGTVVPVSVTEPDPAVTEAEAEEDEENLPVPESDLAPLRESFLKAGRGLSRQMLTSLDNGQFDSAKVGRTVHQWIDTARQLGFPNIAGRAREVETALGKPAEDARLRGPLTSLARAFANPAEDGSTAASHSLVRALIGKRVALIGLDRDAADLVCGAMEQVGAKARIFEATQSPFTDTVSVCHVVLVHVRPANQHCHWLVAGTPLLPPLPTIFYGAAEHVLSLKPAVQAHATGLLLEGCLPDEVLMRLRLAVSYPPVARPRTAAEEPGELVIAYGDSANREQFEARMKEHGLRYRLAGNGPETILLLRDLRPPVAVLNVNMDGIEALATIRAENMPVRTILLGSQSCDDDILRGFSLGAEDYLIQPFSPLELVTRLKRLLG